MKIKDLFFLFWFFVLTHYVSFGQCCSGGVPLSGSLGLSSGEARSLQILTTYDYNVLNQLFEGSTKMDDKTRKRTTHSSLIELSYNLTKRFSVSTMFSWVRQERYVSTISGLSDFNISQGIGDGIVLVKYNLLNPSLDKNRILSIGAGPKIPLGSANNRTISGIALPADMQPGSGAWDLMSWLYFEKYHLFIKNLTFTGITTYRYTGSNPDYFGSQTYRFGNEIMINSQFSYPLFVGKRWFDIMIGTRFRNQQDDLINEELFPNSGGSFLFANVGLRFNFDDKQSIMLNGFVPVYRNVGGTQVTTSGRFQISYLKTFKFNKN